uniref:Glycosyltransferase 2-like domain-containing protein n=1 Tax=viral metagenome TaxID=1070528 RepID=A0A6C0I2P6_9ZZZZ
MSEQTLGAIFQCYKNPYATFKCIESFRKWYPDSTVVLMSDNGHDYTKMADHFNCIYLHFYKSNPLSAYDLEEGKQIEIMSGVFDRVKDAILLCKEDYVMWLEDDVVINRRITSPFLYDLNGYCPNSLLPCHKEGMVKDFPFIDVNKDYRYSGAGGSVFHKYRLLNCLQNVDLVTTLFKNVNSYRMPWNQDFLLSVLILLNKGTVGPYDGHQDGGYDINPNIVVQHQYKRFYKVPMPAHLEHLVDQR